MIIYPDNTIEKQSHRPNENWTDRTDVIFVDDDSELAMKIEKNAPYFNRNLDGNGNLIDITPTERPIPPTPQPTPIEQLQSQLTQSNEDFLGLQKTLNIAPPINNPITLDDYKQNKIYELNTACKNDVLNGFNSNCNGEDHQYKFNLEYQANMNQKATMFLFTNITETKWPTRDIGVIILSKDQFIQLCIDAETVKESKIYRYFTIKSQVEVSTTIEDVNTFIW